MHDGDRVRWRTAGSRNRYHLVTLRQQAGRVVGAARLAVVVTVAVILAAAGARADEAKVKIDNFTFEPQVLTVRAGTTVVWTNADDIPHTVTSSSRGQFKSKALDTTDSFSFTFREAGTFAYFCSLHPHMTATIRVEGTVGDAGPGADVEPTTLLAHRP
ncbi:MAG: cupredoxin family copper-binding protein [Xanthobacteraceae bacterium]